MTSWSGDGTARRAMRGCPARRWLLVIAGIVFCGLVSVGRAHVPVPDSVLHPRSAPEAWNVLRLASENLARLVREDRLAEVPDQASLCPPALRLLAQLAAGTDRQQETAARAVRAVAAVDSLAQACVAGDRPSVKTALVKLQTALHALASDVDPRIVDADVYFCPMHPEVLSMDAASTCPKCGMTLVPRRIPYSFVYVPPPGEPSIHLAVHAGGEPTVGVPLRVTVRLTKGDGSPVRPGDLLIAHTQPVHLLIIDPTLEDYHHEHPVPTGSAGEYEFTFTPARTSMYRVFADLVPAATSVQEYAMAELPGAAAPTATAQASTLAAAADGLKFQLEVIGSEGSLVRAGQAQALRITVRDANGQPVRRLEPVMNEFAHLVGFYDDGRTVVHVHPAGAEVSDANQRGGPSLEFRFFPPKPGFLRLFCQVSVDGKMSFPAFNVNVLP